MKSIQWVKVGFTVCTVRIGIKPVRTFAYQSVVLHSAYAFVTVIGFALELTFVSKKGRFAEITTSTVVVPCTDTAVICAGAVTAASKIRVAAAVV